MFEIEKNIPVPVKDTTDGKSISKQLIETLKTMEVGDSFLLNEKQYSIYGVIKRFGVEDDKIYTARKDKESGNYRIFRTK